MKTNTSAVYALYAISILGSGLGFITQMLVSGFWATAYSNDILYFSVNAAFYFLSLGLGSLYTERLKTPSLATVLTLTMISAVWAGISLSLLKLGIRMLDNNILVPIIVVSVSGFLAGQVIPLVLRVRGTRKGITLAKLFFVDYTAAIVFSFAFTFVLLIPLGYGRTALCLSAVCVLTTFGLVLYCKELQKQIAVLFALGLLLPYPLYRVSTHFEAAPTRKLESQDSAKLIARVQSPYQKIVLTEEKGDSLFFPGIPQHVLYLDGFVRFSSTNEQIYHSCLANVAVSAAESIGASVKRVLIVGGGDGLVARNLLSIPKVQKITVLEADAELVKLAREEVNLRIYNLDSLRHPKVNVVVADPYQWIRDQKESYDLVILDLPLPKNISLSRLFSAEFYSHVFRVLSPKGFVSIHAGPSFALEDRSLQTLSNVSASIKRTVASVGGLPTLYVNPKDNDAFILATSNAGYDAKAFYEKNGMTAGKRSGHACIYSPDWKEPKAMVNTLNTLAVSTYARQWIERSGRPFYFYRGTHAVFLPE